MSTQPASPPRAAAVKGDVPSSAPGDSSGRLVAFVAVAYPVSWGWLLALAVSGASVDAGTGWPSHLPALMGPMVAALLVTRWTDGRTAVRSLLRRMVTARCSAWWWLVTAAFALVMEELMRTHAGHPSVLLPQPRADAVHLPRPA